MTPRELLEKISDHDIRLLGTTFQTAYNAGVQKGMGELFLETSKDLDDKNMVAYYITGHPGGAGSAIGFIMLEHYKRRAERESAL